ncbi:CRISPR-associated endonuclease Cas2 [Nisaea sp.]|uniref:CRISPR-associated endonuclease Cas2 n=1 Tax=Nisaea sp. TaxID=2024842 RepID=UPI003B51F5F5
MTDFLVSYDLRNESGSQDYKPLWDELKRLNAHRVQESVWLVNLNNTAKEVTEHFKAYMDGDDRILVCEFTRKHYFFNAMSGTNNWLTANQPA